MNTAPALDLWTFQTAITRRLTAWSLFSILSGAGMLLAGEFWRGMGVQFLAWGAIDLAIAGFGALGTRRRYDRLDAEERLRVQPQERARLARILWVNAGLDVLYVAGGIALTLTLGQSDAFWRGGGWGIVLQGGFLLVFDVFHALKLR